ncbi:response regulator transcription factor [Sulfobacillus thermosulfidooxidans]|uniref:Stage 0 sporulation protein A homolog n=1 Tax=Sulfobacillus thermosulfidooxidans TaxID=28034 RepID=A0A2T2WRH2_SULTH|nr:response regulator transcription factor [Sulfobacillus thermosulfidooxidans]PSR24813.1 MAG: DNA-binding response regulator [Sulfobacillus thermosulfidooxidans]
MIRIMIIEDQSLVRDALVALLSLQPAIEVIGYAASGQEGVELVRNLKPDVVLLDIQMPRGDGIWATREIRRLCPDVRCLLLTTFAKDEYLRQGLAAGASGYVLKDTPTDEVVRAIEAVLEGKMWITPSMQARLSELFQQDALTERERKVLQLAQNGATNRQIAAALFLAEGSVKNLWTEIFSKLSAKNRVEAIAIAREKGII